MLSRTHLRPESARGQQVSEKEQAGRRLSEGPRHSRPPQTPPVSLTLRQKRFPVARSLGNCHPQPLTSRAVPAPGTEGAPFAGGRWCSGSSKALRLKHGAFLPHLAGLHTSGRQVCAYLSYDSPVWPSDLRVEFGPPL